MMLETKKMLHLRRYLTLIVHSQLHSPRCETVRCCLPRRGGYVFGYVHPRHASLRPEIYVTTCNRTYGTSVSQSVRSDVIDHKLMSFCDNVKKGRVSADDLRKVIDLYSKNDYQLPHSIGVLLLKCCGNLLPDLEVAERDHLASQVWHLAKKSNEALTLEYYNTLLRINEENSKFVNPKKFLANMSLEPDENTYRLLLNAAKKTGNSECLWDIVSMIKDKNTTIYEEAINILVYICVINGNIADVERLITLMQKAKLSTAKVYTELACKYARHGNIPNLVKILNEEPQSNMNLLRIIKDLSMSNNSRHIPVVLNFLMTSVPTIQLEISRMITELVRTDQVVDAHTIINCLAMNNVAKDIVQDFVKSFMNELVILNAPINDIINYANNFVDCGCSDHTLIYIAEIGLKMHRKNLCLAIFEVMRNKNIELRPHYYWPLLLRAYHNKGEAEIFSLVKSMVNQGVEINSDTLLHYIFPYVDTANPFVTIQKLLLNNVPSIVSYTSLLSFLLHQNRLQDVTSLYMDYPRYKVYYRELIKPLINAYLTTKDFKNCVMLFMAFPKGQDFVALFLKSLLRAEHPIYIEDIQLLLTEFKKYEVKISQNDATILKERLQQLETFNVTTKVANLIDNLVDLNMKNSTFMLQLKYMNTEELTYYLVELKSNKANTRSILYHLLVKYCVNYNLKKAEEIKREFDACQYTWTSRMKSILFELYLEHDKLNEAEALLPDLQTTPKEFLLDEAKILLYATVLVKADKPSYAFDIINTPLNTIRTSLYVQQQCYTLLQTLAKSQYHAQTKTMLNLLLKKNYCQITEKLLRPLVVIPLDRQDILGAVEALAECAKKYYEAPLALEILTKLLQEKYSSRLRDASNYIERVHNIIATVYNIKKANTLLAIALATLNKTENLQALLQNHKLSMDCLQYNILKTKTNSETLNGFQNLLKVANANQLDQDIICNKLLFVYSILGNCNRALELWKIMCTKNIKPSKQFEKNFIQFLLSHKVLLPPKLNKSTR